MIRLPVLRLAALIAVATLPMLLSSSLHAACASPTAAAGSMNWNGTAFVYCDGTSWNGFGSQWVNGTAGAISYSGGNVGIGSTSPSNALHVRSTSTSAASLLVTGGTSVGAAHANSSQILLGDIAAARGVLTYDYANGFVYLDNTYDSANADIILRTRTYGTAVSAMTIKGGGNVGIGTTSPGQKLTVAGAIESTSGGFKFPDGTTQTTAASGGGGTGCAGGRSHMQVFTDTGSACACSGSYLNLKQCQNGTITTIQSNAFNASCDNTSCQGSSTGGI